MSARLLCSPPPGGRASAGERAGADTGCDELERYGTGEHSAGRGQADKGACLPTFRLSDLLVCWEVGG